MTLAGITRDPTDWMLQMARNVSDESSDHLNGQRYALHDRDTKFCAAFRNVVRSCGVRPLMLPPQSPNLNAFAERWVRSVKQHCLSKLLFSEVALRRTLSEFIDHYHFERNQQGKGNTLLSPPLGNSQTATGSTVQCKERLGGLLKHYCRAA